MYAGDEITTTPTPVIIPRIASNMNIYNNNISKGNDD
jgi:hypothetical protein